MIKRTNKLTALLVAATSVASIAPMTSVSAATKLETLEGKIESVQAFNNGNYIYEGYKDDSQDNSIYFSNGTKDTEIEDVDNFEFEVFGKELINFTQDEVLFNLSTGKENNESKEEIEDLLKMKFQSSIVKKVDRYDEATIDTDNVINAGQFGDVWYNYTATGSGVEYKGFVNQSRTYVDASHTMNITHYGKDGKVTLNTKKDAEKKGYTVVESDALYADADYIYRFVTLQKADEEDTVYLQKISKAQGEKEDDAYLPKSVASYLIEEDSIVDDLTESDAENNKVDVRVINGSLYSIKYNGSKLEVVKYDLVKNRDEDAVITDRINRVSKDEDYDFDTKKVDNYTFDVNGNVWVLYNGNIQKLVKDELTTVYTTDRSMDAISVYDDNDIVVWNTENEIYATVAGENTSVDEDNKEDDKEEVVAGWVKNSDGTWSYNKADGTKATGWLNLNGTWYYLDNNGIMQTGWLNLSGTWYYLQSSGAMATGWLNLNGTWYYLQPSGAMATGWLNLNGTWYYLQPSGAMHTGWLNDNGTWYYLQSSGAMAANTTVDGYRLGANGAWIR